MQLQFFALYIHHNFIQWHYNPTKTSTLYKFIPCRFNSLHFTQNAISPNDHFTPMKYQPFTISFRTICTAGTLNASRFIPMTVSADKNPTPYIFNLYNFNFWQFTPIICSFHDKCTSSNFQPSTSSSHTISNPCTLNPSQFHPVTISPQ